MNLKNIALFALLALSSLPALAQQDEQQTVNSAQSVLERMKNEPSWRDSIQPKIDEARAVLIVPALYKGGFVFGGQYGNGVLLSKLADGNWSYPAFYTMEGGSFGLQIGLESTAVIFTIMSDKGLHAVLNNQFKFGADSGLTVLVVGAGIGASTTSNLGADLYAFSMNGIGLYGGLSLEGTVLSARESWNAVYYNQEVTARAIVLDNAVSNPKADPLRDILAH